MPRQVVSINKNKKHLTKAEKTKRGAAEKVMGEAPPIKTTPPAWLDETAKKEWRRLIKECKAMGILSTLDMGALAICCDAYSKYMAATLKINDTTLVGTHTNKSGAKNLVINPFVMVAQKYSDTYKKYATDLGLTPAARMRMTTINTPEPEKDELIDFIKRRNRVRGTS
jgi:P27 family predicted phage terminase small subunit